MKKLSILSALLLCTISTAQAQLPAGAYVGAEFAAVNSDADFDDWDTGVVFARVGMVLVPGLAVEGYLGLGVQDESWTSANGCDSENVSTDSIIGAQVKGFVDLGHHSNLHGTIGLNMVSASFEISGSATCYGVGWSETYDDTEMALTYGFGADIGITKQSAITVNYQIFYDDDYSGIDLLVSGLRVGYQHSF